MVSRGALESEWRTLRPVRSELHPARGSLNDVNQPAEDDSQLWSRMPPVCAFYMLGQGYPSQCGN